MTLYARTVRYMATSAIVLALSAPAFAQTTTEEPKQPPAATETAPSGETTMPSDDTGAPESTTGSTPGATPGDAGDENTAEGMDSDTGTQPNTVTESPAQSPTTSGQDSAAADDGLPEDPILLEQEPQQLVSTEVIGTDVRNPQDEKIGTIDALVFDEQDRIIAGVVSVGGFLGIGAKNVAVNWKELEFQPEEKVAVVMLSREQLEEAPAYRDREEVQAQIRAEQQRLEIETQQDNMQDQAAPPAAQQPAD